MSGDAGVASRIQNIAGALKSGGRGGSGEQQQQRYHR
eukprot:COSAG06_NODE_24738_length_653_cov_82.929603_2_plen_36_part_01